MIKDPKKASGPKGLKVDISPEALDLFTKMIAEDPTARPTPADIIAHPWFIYGSTERRSPKNK
jgi:serine/threonine protein kinase